MMDVVFKTVARVGGQFKYTEQEEKSHQKLRSNALNTILLDTKDIGTLSFEEAQKEAEYLRIKGQMQTAGHFDLHGIAPITDPNFEQKDFVLKVYEESKDTGLLQGWKNKVIGGKQEKSSELLKFADSKWSNDSSRQEVLKEMVLVAATSRTNSTLSNNTTTMQTMVNSLNDAFTPTVVREDFIKLLKIDKSKDIRFEQDKSNGENLANFKFDAKDFDNLLTHAKSSSVLIKQDPSQVKFQDQVATKKSKGTILHKEKQNNHRDKVIEELKGSVRNRNQR